MLGVFGTDTGIKAVIAEPIFIAVVVIVVTHLVGDWIGGRLNENLRLSLYDRSKENV